MNKILDNKKNKVSDALIENIEFSDKISLEQKIINLLAPLIHELHQRRS